MAVTFKIILQDVVTQEYVTETGTSPNISEAKLFSTVDFNTLPTGSFSQTQIVHVT